MTRLCQQAEARVQALQKTLRRAIGKSRPYFELKAQFSQILEVAEQAAGEGGWVGMKVWEEALQGPSPGQQSRIAGERGPWEGGPRGWAPQVCSGW